MHIVVIGMSDVGRRVCGALHERGVQTTHLDDPSDADVREALTDEVDGVAVLLHDDIRAMRYSLVVEHARPGIRLFVAIFDRTARMQLESVIKNCVVLSPAAISVPSIVAAAVAPECHAVRRQGSSSLKEWVSIGTTSPPSTNIIRSFAAPRPLRLKGWFGRLFGQLHPYDSGSAVLIGGALGLALVILIDTIVGARDHSSLRALYDAARTTATIGSAEVPNETWPLLWASVAAILVMGLTAAFAAGIVHHLISGRHVALFGRRVVPRRGHVIIGGMGQVGVRLAQELRALGIAVVGIERFADAAGLGVARDLGIPVIVGDAASRRVLRRASLGHAVAVVAAGSEERDNIAMAISALAVRDDIAVVLRAGADDAIDETRSLFHIGSVVDVNGLTAAFVVESMIATEPYAVLATDTSLVAIDRDGATLFEAPVAPVRCTC